MTLGKLAPCLCFLISKLSRILVHTYFIGAIDRINWDNDINDMIDGIIFITDIIFAER